MTGALVSLAAALRSAGLDAELRTDGIPDLVKVLRPPVSSAGLSVIVDHVPPAGARWFRSSGDGRWLGPCEDLPHTVTEIGRVLDGLTSSNVLGEDA